MKAAKLKAASILREKAEELIDKKSFDTSEQHSESEPLKLIHELEVHRIELELQNEDLMQAISGAKDAIELYDFAPSGYFTLSNSGEILRLNINGAKMLGKDRLLLRNYPFSSFVSEDTRPVFNQFLVKVFESKAEETCELTLSVNGNSLLNVHLSGIVVNNRSHCLVTAVDISEIRKLTELNEILLDSLPYPAMYVRRKDRVVLACNKIALDFGVKPGSHCWRDFMKAGFISHHQHEMLAEYDDHVPSDLNIKCSFCIGDQCFTGFPQQNNPEVNAFGLIWNTYWIKVSDEVFLHYAVNITEQKLAEAEIKHKNEELRFSNAEKDKFFSIIAHDLRSPFNGFLGLTEIMVEKLPTMSLDDIQKIALVLRNSATNLYRLLGNLLEWSRMQRGLTEFAPSTYLIMPKITESLMSVLSIADKKGIPISYDIPEDIEVFADVNMFECIIRNLVSNAVKFSNKGEGIVVSAKICNDWFVEISVKDQGIGMNLEMINNLFRLDANTCRRGTENEYSTGLGLIICKDFIEKNGGKLSVESDPEGISGDKGSTFSFTLPGKV
jgi:signal transduction histidine kinase